MPARPLARRPSAGPDEFDPTRAQRLDVGLRGCMSPHLRVHRGGDHYWRRRRERRQCDHVARAAVRQPRQEVGRGGRDHEGVDAACDLDMGLRFGRSEHVDDDLAPAE